MNDKNMQLNINQEAQQTPGREHDQAQGQEQEKGTCGCGANKPGGCGNRLREKPEERFKGTVHRYTIEEAFARLQREVAVGHQGHRQIALYQDKGVTVAAFEFAPGARLKPHKAHGEVVIQGVEGRLEIVADGQPHVLRKGDLLVMRPGVVHEVATAEGAKMLLTVLHKDAAGA